MAARKICSIEGCGNKHSAKGYCNKHHKRWKAHGDPLVRKNAKPGESLVFLEKIVANPPKGCVFWPFGKTGRGYANINYQGKTHLAHRLALQLYTGRETDLLAAHECGNGHLGCMNPRCLYWATVTQNNHDAIRHGTQTRGEATHFSKLKEPQVLAILADKRPQLEIAAAHGVDPSTVSNIKTRKTWKHVG